MPDANFKQDCQSEGMDSIIHDLCQQVAALAEDREQITHLSTPVTKSINPLTFLAHNTNFRQFYWQGRNQITLAGLDCCVEHNDSEMSGDAEKKLLPVNSETDKGYQPLYLNAFSFNGQSGQGIWEGFPAGYSVLPQICLIDREGDYSLHLHLKASATESWEAFKRKVISKLRSLTWEMEQTSVIKKRGCNESCNLDPKKWRFLCDQVQETIRNSPLEKVVLARQLSLHLEHVEPQLVLHKWLQNNPDSYGFMVQLHGKTFLGCSPERLYQRVGRQLYTESLAGTVRRGKDRETDKAQALRLQSEPKLVKEHALVSDFIQQQLAPMSKNIEMGKIQSWPLDRIRHSYQQITAQLNEETNDNDIIDALHPTPAICGYPRESARGFIQSNEELERGWYSGGIGIIGHDYADYAVAIRSAIIANNTLHCFSGVGLVEGADAEQEWQELDAKLESLLNVIYG